MKKLVLISVLILVVLYSTAYAGKPPQISTSKPGYVMFNDASSNVIISDGQGVYKDCKLGGTDEVVINIWSDGSFRYLKFYPGVMSQRFSNCSNVYSPRRIKFLFNVSNIPPGQTAPLGDQNGNAVHEILRWYRDASVPHERSATKGFIDDDSLHAPIRVNVDWGYTPPIIDFIQFVLDPRPSPSPGTDLKAITQSSVDSFYSNDTNVDYWTTQDPPDNECAPYVVYTLLYGDLQNSVAGFSVEPVQWGKNRKPVTWIVKPTNNIPVRLIVVPTDIYNEPITLTTYTIPLPFEFAVSLNLISSYPVKQAPPKINTISTAWGEIKGGE